MNIKKLAEKEVILLFFIVVFFSECEFPNIFLKDHNILEADKVKSYLHLLKFLNLLRI